MKEQHCNTFCRQRRQKQEAALRNIKDRAESCMQDPLPANLAEIVMLCHAALNIGKNAPE